MKLKTTDLTGPALDWAVAKCENADWSDEDCIVNVTTFDEYDGTICNYSTDWAQGGLIIERERISISTEENGWSANICAPRYGFSPGFGPTPLIAALRFYVASKLGDEIDVPDELVKE